MSHSKVNTSLATNIDASMPIRVLLNVWESKVLAKNDPLWNVIQDNVHKYVNSLLINLRDEIRHALKANPYQPKLLKYPSSGLANHLR